SIDGRAGIDTIIATDDGDFTLTSGQLSISPGETFLQTAFERAELTGGASANRFDTSAFSGAAVIEGGAGNDSFIGGPGDTTYVFDTDTPLGQDTITDSGGTDTLDFFPTMTQSVTVNLMSLDTSTPQTINVNLTLTLLGGATMENVIGGALNDTITGNALYNRLAGGLGDDTYVFDTDLVLGNDTIYEAPGAAGGIDTLDFSPTTSKSVTVNLADGSPQI